MVTLPRETARFGSWSGKPVIVTVAGRFTECLLIADQVSASGVQVHAAANCGESLGSSFVTATVRGSISPMRSRWPGDSACIAAEPSPKVMSIRQRFALSAVSRQRKAGAVISGGKTDPSSG